MNNTINHLDLTFTENLKLKNTHSFQMHVAHYQERPYSLNKHKKIVITQSIFSDNTELN